MSEAAPPDGVGRSSGTTGDDRRTALRFVLGRPGWQVQALVGAEGVGTHLRLTTPCRDTGGQRSWRVERTLRGLTVHDASSGQRFKTVPTMREALVEIWEAVTETASD